MTTSATTNMASAGGWLAFAASPTFALMAAVEANGASHMALCAAGAGALPIGGMTAMYLLMSLFHLAPWLKLASARARTRNWNSDEGDRR